MHTIYIYIYNLHLYSFICIHRQHKEDFEHFTESQRVMIRDTITKTVNYLKESNNGNIYDIDDYLQ